MNGLPRRTLTWACPLLLLITAGSAHGQNSWISRISLWDDASESHAEIPFASKTFTEFQRRVLLTGLLKDPGNALQDEQTQRLLKEIIDSGEFQRLQQSDPVLHQRVEVLKGFLDGDKNQPGEMLKLRESAARMLQDYKAKNSDWLESILHSPAGDRRMTSKTAATGAPAETPAPPPASAGSEMDAAAEPSEPESDGFERWLLSQTDRFGRWSERYGHWPTLQQALESARRGVADADWQKQSRAAKETYLGKQMFRLVRRLEPEKYLEQLNLSARQRLGASPLGRFALPKPAVPWGQLPSLGVPNFGLPGGNGQGDDTGLVGLLVAAVSAQALWFIHHKRKQSRAARAGRKADGTWPVMPAAVSSRDELIQAFEYLSVLQLGPGARSWNHLDIADALGEGGPQRRGAADRLAALYEHARYAPGNEPLGEESLAAARRSLSFLAGASAA